jgi:hypothetical protein
VALNSEGINPMRYHMNIPAERGKLLASCEFAQVWMSSRFRLIIDSEICYCHNYGCLPLKKKGIFIKRSMK